MKKESKGITLIALIITIIVMLILVGVTVSVALNGRLFKTAKDAARDTQIEVDRETLQSAVWGAIGKDGIVNESNIKLPDGWNVDNGIYRSPKENKFKINKEEGTVEKVIVRNSTELERYVFGEAGTGRDILALLENDDDGNAFFSDDSLDVKFLALSAIDIGNNTIYGTYIKYEGKVYKFQGNLYNDSCITNSNIGIKLVYDSEEEKDTKVGKYVKYDGKNWIVLYDDNTNGLQMISADVLEIDNVYLGKKDTTIDESKVEDFDGIQGISNFEKAIYSYNHAIETLNKRCESLVTKKEGIVKSVRSVGSNPINPYSENGALYNLTGDFAWANEKFYGTDFNYETDFDRLTALGINKPNNNQSYWLASRLLDTSTGDNGDQYFYPNMRIVYDSDWWAEIKYLTGLEAGGGINVDTGDFYSGVRPVIILENGVLDGLSGNGTTESPLILE